MNPFSIYAQNTSPNGAHPKFEVSISVSSFSEEEDGTKLISPSFTREEEVDAEIEKLVKHLKSTGVNAKRKLRENHLSGR